MMMILSAQACTWAHAQEHGTSPESAEPATGGSTFGGRHLL
jgi:hypothetical protein